ncbi:MAG: hypothetical protein PHN88_02400 [Ignavibacteria bacterium]|nr:hypothetical protein [Ignavibacteria bacterium]
MKISLYSFFILLSLFLSASAQNKDSIPEPSSYYEGILGFRVGTGWPLGNLNEIYDYMPAINAFYQIRLNKHIYTGFNLIFFPQLGNFDGYPKKSKGYGCFLLNGKYAFEIDSKHSSAYIESGAGIYKTEAITGLIPHKVFETQSNFGFNFGIGIDGHITKGSLIDLNILYHNYYDSRNGGNWYSFIGLLVGIKIIENF